MEIKFTDNSKEVLKRLEKAKEKALWAIGATAEGYAKKDTPVDTGRLRNSITHAETNQATYIGSNVEYAPYVELGSPTIKAHHMLQKAATKHSTEYKALAKEAMENT